MAEYFVSLIPVAINELTPEISDPSTKSIKAIVTLIWPYSSSNQNLTVRLADPDVRRRLAQGQTRVSFLGSSARTIYEAGIGSGDKITLCLDGVGWVKDGSTAQNPGRGIEWELTFTERLLLEIRDSETEKVTIINIDGPLANDLKPASINSAPESVPSAPESIAPISNVSRLFRAETNEWSSPAFIKRARLSYGSLMESNYDIFAEADGSIPGKGRKRTKFSRESGKYRFSSLSPSPESEKAADNTDISDSEVEAGPRTELEPLLESVLNMKPLMLDEGCQTVDLRNDTAEALGNLSRLSAAVGSEVLIPSEDTTGELGDSNEQPDGVATMPPPPKPQLVIDAGLREEFGDQEAVEMASNPPSSPRLRPVPSEGLSLVSPLVSPSPDRLYGHREAERSWTQHSTLEENASQTLEFQLAKDNFDLQPRYGGSYLDTARQYNNWESSAAADDHLREFQSPTRGEEDVRYPDFDHQLEDELSLTDSGPYFTNNLPQFPSYSGDHGIQSFVQPEHESVEGGGESVDEQEDDNAYLSANPSLSHHSSIAISRSQSAQSEVIDLTEDSDEDYETGIADTERHYIATKQPHQNEPNDNYFVQDEDDVETFDKEGEDTARLDNNEDEDEEGEEYSEDEFNEDGAPARHHPGLHPVDQAPLRSYDEVKHEEIGESEDDYEDEGVDKETRLESRQDSPKQSAFVAEVIDLLSSDEGDRSVAEVDDNEMSDAGKEDPTIINEILADLVEKDEEGAAVVKHLLPSLEERDKEVGETLGPAKNTKDDLEHHDTYADLENDESHHAETMLSPSRYQGHQELDAVDIDMQKAQTIVRKVPTERVEIEDASDNPEMEQNEWSVPGIIAGGLARVESRVEVVHDRDSGSIEEGWHDAHNIPSEGQTDSLIENYSDLFTRDVTNHQEAVSEAAPAEESSMVLVNGDKKLLSEDSFYPLLPLEQLEKYSQTKETTKGQLPTPDATQLTMGAPMETVLDSLVPNRPATSSQSRGQVKEISHVVITVESTVVEQVDNNAYRKESIPIPPQTPKRHMRTRSSTSQQSLKTDRSSSIILEDPTTYRGYDASAELALGALDSPTKIHCDVHSQYPTALKLQLSKSLRTNLGAFTALKSLRFHKDLKVDVLAIATSATHPEDAERKKKGARHYQVTFSVTDPSLNSSVTEVEVFRPYKEALPIVSVGDGVLLRNFLVKSDPNHGFLLRSEDASSWAVFTVDGGEEMRGPPVELGDMEREHITSLKLWFTALDATTKSRLDNASGEAGGSHGNALPKSH